MQINQKRSLQKWVFIGILFAILQTILTFSIHQIFLNNTPGMDFHIYWVAGRAIENGISPYGDEVALESQIGVLDRPARPDEDQMGFAYPIYALLPVFPTIRLPFDWAQAAWFSFNLLGLSLVMILSFPKAPLRALLLASAFYPLTFALILGNMNIPVAAILILGIRLISMQKDHRRSTQVILGILLAWATIKPQFGVFFLAFIAFYALREKLKPLMVSFVISMLVFLAASTIIWPAWLTEWIGRMRAYTGYIASDPMLLLLLKRFLPDGMAMISVVFLAVLLAIITGILGVRWWRNRFSPSLFLAWIGFISYISMPQSVSYEQIRFFIPLLIWLALSPSKTAAWWIFGPVYILFSWVIFGISRIAPQAGGIEELRFLVYVIWMIWIFVQNKPKAKDNRTGNIYGTDHLSEVSTI